MKTLQKGNVLLGIVLRGLPKAARWPEQASVKCIGRPELIAGSRNWAILGQLCPNLVGSTLSVDMGD